MNETTTAGRAKTPCLVLVWVAVGCAVLNTGMSFSESVSVLAILSRFVGIAPYVLLAVYLLACHGRGKGRVLVPVIWTWLCVGQLISLGVYAYQMFVYLPQEYYTDMLASVFLGRLLFSLPTILLLGAAAVGLFVKPGKKLFSILGASGGGILLLMNAVNLISNLHTYHEYDLGVDVMRQVAMPLVSFAGVACFYTALLLVGLFADEAKEPPMVVGSPIPEPMAEPTPNPVSQPADAPADAPANAPAGAVVNIDDYIATHTPEESLRFLRHMRELGAISEATFQSRRDEIIGKL